MVGTDDTWLSKTDDEEEEEEEDQKNRKQKQKKNRRQLWLQNKEWLKQQQQRQWPHWHRSYLAGQLERGEDQRGTLRHCRNQLFLNDLPRTMHENSVAYVQPLEAPSTLTQFLKLKPKTDMPFCSDCCSHVAEDGSDTSSNNEPEVDDDGQFVRKRTELFDPPPPYVMRRLPKRLPEVFKYYGRTGNFLNPPVKSQCSDEEESFPPS